MDLFGDRLGMAGNGSFLIGRLKFDPRSGELRSGGETRRVEPRAAAVLQMLCGADGAVVTRQELLDRCWGEGEGSDEALTQAIAQIRRTLDDLGEPHSVETLTKRGYRLRSSLGRSGPVESRPTPASWRGVYIWLVIAVMIFTTALMFPHEARHAFRHSLGLGAYSHSDSH